jgi:hypothetical protein
MKTSEKGRPSPNEAEEYRRKAKDAEHAAETAESAEAKEFYLAMAKNYHELASKAEKGGH